MINLFSLYIYVYLLLLATFSLFTQSTRKIFFKYLHHYHAILIVNLKVISEWTGQNITEISKATKRMRSIVKMILGIMTYLKITGIFIDK